MSKDPLDISIIYYTSNYLDDKNPYFVKNTRKQLKKAAGDYPIITVSQKPTDFGDKNVMVGDIGRSHLNLYGQILEGCRAARTKYVAMAEDDILYSYAHFHTKVPEGNSFLYDLNKVSIFTWTDPPLFSFRFKRKVVNQLIAPRDYLIDALEERFARYDYLIDKGKTKEQIIKFWGDPGRYEDHLGVTVRKRTDFTGIKPSIVFTHEYAYGYLNHGQRKRLGDLRIVEIEEWGRAEDILKLFYHE